MLYRTGTVIEIRGRFARVEFDDAVACGGCAAGQGCGLGPLLAMFRPRRQSQLDLPVRRGHRMRVGDRVRAAIPADRLVKGASLAYLLPLFGLMACAWLATVLSPGSGDLGAVLGAVAGVTAAWGCLRAFGNPL